MAAAIVAVVVALAATIFVLTVGHGASQNATTDPCSLLTQPVMESLAWNGAGHEVSGLNQSAPPWDFQSIYDHIQQGWQTLCKTTAFTIAIQDHGAGISAGGGFINKSSPANSQVGIVIPWTQTTSTNCTAYEETWSIYIVNGSVSNPTTITIGECIYATTQ